MFHKIRFTSPQYGHTAGLVLRSSQLERDGFNPSILFPYSEAMKMRTLQASPPFATWGGAFDYEFPA